MVEGTTFAAVNAVLKQLYPFVSSLKKCIYSPDMNNHAKHIVCFIDPFTVYVTGKFEVRSAHFGVRKFIPSH